MKKITILVAALMAGSFAVNPAFSQSQKRKTLFEVLFPKAHERKLEKERERLRLQALATPKEAGAASPANALGTHKLLPTKLPLATLHPVPILDGASG